MTSSDMPRQDRALPLTDHTAETTAGAAVDESTIRSLVDGFYEEIRADATLGPIFARHVADWTAHLPKMYDFWSTVILHTGRYSGRPIIAHAQLPDLTHEHFARWLELWRAAVARFVPAPARSAFVIAAERMARSMASRLVA